jgi:hypothetical protein
VDAAKSVEVGRSVGANVHRECGGALVGQASTCPLAFIECDFVRKPRSERLRLRKSAQALSVLRVNRSACAT